MRGKPRLHGGEVLIGRPKLLTKLLRREPPVIAGRAGCVEIVDELFESSLLSIAALEEEREAVERHAVGRHAAIVGAICERMHGSLEGDPGIPSMGCVMRVVTSDEEICAATGREGRNARAAAKSAIGPRLQRCLGNTAFLSSAIITALGVKKRLKSPGLRGTAILKSVYACCSGLRHQD